MQIHKEISVRITWEFPKQLLYELYEKRTWRNHWRNLWRGFRWTFGGIFETNSNVLLADTFIEILGENCSEMFRKCFWENILIFFLTSWKNLYIDTQSYFWNRVRKYSRKITGNSRGTFIVNLLMNYLRHPLGISLSQPWRIFWKFSFKNSWRNFKTKSLIPLIVGAGGEIGNYQRVQSQRCDGISGETFRFLNIEETFGSRIILGVFDNFIFFAMKNDLWQQNCMKLGRMLQFDRASFKTNFEFTGIRKHTMT